MFLSDIDQYKKFMNLNFRLKKCWVRVILEVKSAALAGRKKFLKISSLHEGDSNPGVCDAGSFCLIGPKATHILSKNRAKN